MPHHPLNIYTTGGGTTPPPSSSLCSHQHTDLISGCTDFQITSNTIWIAEKKVRFCTPIMYGIFYTLWCIAELKREGAVVAHSIEHF